MVAFESRSARTKEILFATEIRNYNCCYNWFLNLQTAEMPDKQPRMAFSSSSRWEISRGKKKNQSDNFQLNSLLLLVVVVFFFFILLCLISLEMLNIFDPIQICLQYIYILRYGRYYSSINCELVTFSGLQVGNLI